MQEFAKTWLVQADKQKTPARMSRRHNRRDNASLRQLCFSRCARTRRPKRNLTVRRGNCVRATPPRARVELRGILRSAGLDACRPTRFYAARLDGRIVAAKHGSFRFESATRFAAAISLKADAAKHCLAIMTPAHASRRFCLSAWTSHVLANSCIFASKSHRFSVFTIVRLHCTWRDENNPVVSLNTAFVSLSLLVAAGQTNRIAIVMAETSDKRQFSSGLRGRSFRPTSATTRWPRATYRR